ncbi:MAG: oligosaccharide flippase family protein, partial [Methylocapsa sp.]|nr:oligosaccharide flippase family protein [Methylocapsa sp.]
MIDDVNFAGLPAGKARTRGPFAIHEILSGGSPARRFARRGIGLSVATAAGQLSYILVLPILSRMFPPSDFGDFIIYLSIVNISAPLAGLRFESALYSAPDKARARTIFRLSLSTIAFMSAMAGGIIFLTADFLPSDASHALRPLRLLLPLGIFMAGLWDLASAWAIRRDAMRTLAIARFAQPFVLALLQIAFGLLALPAASLVVAHIGSYAAYALIIFLRTMTREDVAGIAATTLRQIAGAARQEIKFLFYTTPAFIITLLISNLPPLFMGSLFGAEIAGNYGIAYRVIYGPLTVISYPLSNIFTAEASASHDPAAVQTAARFMFAVSLVLVAAPAAVFGLAAPQLAPIALGARW